MSDLFDGILKPCPFCDENRPIIIDYTNPYNDKQFEVHCAGCGVTTRMFDSAHNATEFWNSRK